MAGTEDTLIDIFGELANSVMALALGAVLFEPSHDGASQIGGEPRFSSQVNWPVRPAPEKPDSSAPRFYPEQSAELRAHLTGELPLSFIAQIDLAEAAATGVETGLPETGQLLFFYDLIGGPHDSSRASMAVIWDQGADPVQVSFPEVLVKAEAAWLERARAPWPVYQQQYFRAGQEAAGLSNAEIDQMLADIAKDRQKNPVPPPYRGPMRRFAAYAGLSLPTERDASFSDVVPQDMQREILEYGPLSDLWISFTQGIDPPRPQMGGYAFPMQDDPRFNAFAMDAYGQHHLDPTTWKAKRPDLIKGAQEWRLLFQIAASYYLDRPEEGMIYFLIHKDDLAARRFDRAIAVYHQT